MEFHYLRVKQPQELRAVLHMVIVCGPARIMQEHVFLEMDNSIWVRAVTLFFSVYITANFTNSPCHTVVVHGSMQVRNRCMSFFIKLQPGPFFFFFCLYGTYNRQSKNEYLQKSTVL